MRNREFWLLADEVFGPTYARSLARDLVIDALDGRSAAQAIEAGDEPRTVWHALCDAMDVPDERRWGADGRRPAPPRR